jgi:hypothetical protein
MVVDRPTYRPKRTNWLHGTEFFLRSRQFCSYSRTSNNFTEPEDALPSSQETSTGPYPEPDESSPHHPILLNVHFNIILLRTSWSSQWYLSFWLSHHYPVCIPPLPMLVAYPANLILLDLIILIMLGEGYISWGCLKHMNQPCATCVTVWLVKISSPRHLCENLKSNITMITMNYSKITCSLPPHF